ncbi:UNVERIFIED_CONTAM: alpha-glucosidase, partial [Prevotella sp. 15_C9]
MKTIGSAIIMLVLTPSLFADNGKELKLTSPDGTHEIAFYQKQVSPVANELCYRVDYKTHPVVNESRAGLELDN